MYLFTILRFSCRVGQTLFTSFFFCLNLTNLLSNLKKVSFVKKTNLFFSHKYIGDKFEGDMMLNPDQISAVIEQDSKNQFAAIKASHWKRNGVAIPIPYFLEESLGW